MRNNRSCLTWAFLLFSTSPLVARDTPIGTPGTEVATEDTPAAATNTDALRKAAQNPVASLISVSNSGELELQHRTERSHPECDERSACDSGQRGTGLEPHHPLDYADHLPTRWSTATPASNRRPSCSAVRRLWFRRHATRIFPLSEEGQGDLGRRTAIASGNGYKDGCPWAGEVRVGSDSRCPGTARQVAGISPGSPPSRPTWKPQMAVGGSPHLVAAWDES